MKQRNNKKKELIQALASRNKDKLRSALAINLPEKWITVSLDHSKQTIDYNGRLISKAEMESIITEEEKEHCVKLVIMNLNRDEDGIVSEDWLFPRTPDINVVYQKVSMKLK